MQIKPFKKENTLTPKSLQQGTKCHALAFEFEIHYLAILFGQPVFTIKKQF